jgi:hypothetical protein
MLGDRDWLILGDIDEERDGDIEELTLLLILSLMEGDTLALGDCEGDKEGETLLDIDALILSETLGLIDKLIEGETEALSLEEMLGDTLSLTLGDRLEEIEGLTLAEGLTEGDVLI